ncbi:MAG: type IV pilus twitching motility protein PilT [Vulcanimicrobiaceae bacterium]
MTRAGALGEVAIRELLARARSIGASDLHLTPDRPAFARVDGALRPLDDQPLGASEIARIADSLLDPIASASLQRHGHADRAVRDPAFGPLRLHAFRAGGQLHLAIRLLAQTVPSLESLHLPAILPTLAGRTSGLLLIVGPTGSGKTTTLAALVDGINRAASRHIVTIEDPVEYRHPPIRSLIAHREVGPDAATHSDALRSSLRADPDVIVIGELRHPETIATALVAAETGRLVVTTLHAASAAQAVDRIVDAFGPAAQAEIRAQLAQTLVGIVAQRLVRLVAGGRRAAAEVLVATDGVRALIRERKTHQLRNAIATGREAGMQTLEAHLSELVVRRVVTVAAARECTDRPDEVRSIARAAPAQQR